MLPLQQPSRYLLWDTCKDTLVLTSTQSLPGAELMGEAMAAVRPSGCSRVVVRWQVVRSLASDINIVQLIRLWRAVRQVGGRLVLCDLDPQIGELFKATLLNQVLEVRTDLTAALGIQVPDPAWLRWNDGTVARLAQAIADEQAFDRLPILADALEEAGCTDATLLSHCRQPTPHAGYCWLIDILTRRS